MTASNNSSENDAVPSLDAIPKNAVWLTEAYGYVVDSIVDLAEFAPASLEFWQEELAASRALEQEVGHDPEAFDGEIEHLWHRRKEANLFLREALNDSALTACVRDPDTGQTLRLASTNWTSTCWSDNGYVPPGIWSDFLDPRDSDLPGPSGSMLRGSLRPVFIVKEEFELWLASNFEEAATVDDSNALPAIDIRELNSSRGYQKNRGDLKSAIKNVALKIWGRVGPPSGMTVAERNRTITSELEKTIRRQPNDRTIRRALKELSKNHDNG
jgi:hypothetical protein